MKEIPNLPEQIKTVLNRLAIESPPEMAEIALAYAEFDNRLAGTIDKLSEIAIAYEKAGKGKLAQEFIEHSLNASGARTIYGNLIVWYSQLKFQADNDRSDLRATIATLQKVSIALTESERERVKLSEQLGETL